MGEVWSIDAPTESPTFLWIQEYLRLKRIPLRIVSAASPPTAWGAARLTILNPQARAKSEDAMRQLRTDERSLVLRIDIGSQAALLTADVEAQAEAILVTRPAALRAQVIVVPHHGSRSSSGAAFVAAVRPDVALISAGFQNRFRHPHPEVVERYERLGARVLRTDVDGAISVEMTAEGTRAWAERKNGS